MTPARLRRCLEILGWSNRHLAARLRWDESHVRRWLAGDYPMPDEPAAWVETLASFIEAHPAPPRT